jgi:hypothetical protein
MMNINSTEEDFKLAMEDLKRARMIDPNNQEIVEYYNII